MSSQNKNKPRMVLVTGARGMLGTDLCALLRSKGRPLIEADLTEFDLTDQRATTDFVTTHKPQIIINCAAYTAVDQAESDPDNAFRINRDGAGNIARAAAEVGAFLFHLSTDYVFDGKKTAPYAEEDLPNPTSVYGRSKLAGEKVVQAILHQCCIVRTSWLFGLKGRSFPRTILSLAAEGKQLRVVHDQRGSPTYTVHLASALADMIQRPQARIYHVVNSGNCTWYEFACYLLKEAGFDIEISPITTADHPLPAPRPANSMLDTTKLRRDFKLTLPDWQQAAKEFIACWRRETETQHSKET